MSKKKVAVSVIMPIYNQEKLEENHISSDANRCMEKYLEMRKSNENFG